ncbi:MAG: NTP transferase domain-containing protein [Actinobacteria bacterium]|nr:NTP transferase domain-containing protein [Actinomycetota bacterium]
MAHRSLSAMVLAAGEGTRMRSMRPKPLHLLCGRAMLLYVLDSLADIAPKRAIVVVGHGAERVTKKLQEDDPDFALDFVEQQTQRGTGDAVSVGLTAMPDDELDDADSDILVLPGDTPLLRSSTIAALIDRHRTTDAACTVLTAQVPDPSGYGRVVRDKDDRVARIVEQADAFGDELAIDEINTSIYCFRLSVLAPALRRLSPENAQGEYYLTDVVEVLHDAGYPVFSLIADDFRETQGVNDRVQLAQAEAELRRRTNESWLRRGVTMLDPERTYIDATVELGTDVTLFPGTMLQGRCVIGDGAELGPDTRLVDCVVGKRSIVEKTIGHDAEVGEDVYVGPFAVLEPGSVVSSGGGTGPFYTALSSDDAGG